MTTLLERDDEAEYSRTTVDEEMQEIMWTPTPIRGQTGTLTPSTPVPERLNVGSVSPVVWSGPKSVARTIAQPGTDDPAEQKMAVGERGDVEGSDERVANGEGGNLSEKMEVLKDVDVANVGVGFTPASVPPKTRARVQLRRINSAPSTPASHPTPPSTTIGSTPANHEVISTPKVEATRNSAATPFPSNTASKTWSFTSSQTAPQSNFSLTVGYPPHPSPSHSAQDPPSPSSSIYDDDKEFIRTIKPHLDDPRLLSATNVLGRLTILMDIVAEKAGATGPPKEDNKVVQKGELKGDAVLVKSGQIQSVVDKGEDEDTIMESPHDETIAEIVTQKSDTFDVNTSDSESSSSDLDPMTLDTPPTITSPSQSPKAQQIPTLHAPNPPPSTLLSPLSHAFPPIPPPPPTANPLHLAVLPIIFANQTLRISLPRMRALHMTLSLVSKSWRHAIRKSWLHLVLQEFPDVETRAVVGDVQGWVAGYWLTRVRRREELLRMVRASCLDGVLQRLNCNSHPRYTSPRHPRNPRLSTLSCCRG